MQFKVISLGFIVSVLAFSAVAAEESNKADYGVSFANNGMVYVKKTITEASAIYAGLGISGSQYDGDLNQNSNFYFIALGARNYLSKGSLSKFVNLEISRGRSSSGGDLDYQSISTSAFLSYGIEYYLLPNLSIEGAAGVASTWGDFTSSTSSYSYRSNTIPLTRLALTYYW